METQITCALGIAKGVAAKSSHRAGHGRLPRYHEHLPQESLCVTW